MVLKKWLISSVFILFLISLILFLTNLANINNHFLFLKNTLFAIYDWDLVDSEFRVLLEHISLTTLWLFFCFLISAISKILSSRYSRLIILVLILSFLIIGVGVTNMATIVFFIIGIFVIGFLLLRWFYRVTNIDGLCFTEAGLVGFLSWLFIMNILIHFKINYYGIYWGICLFSILLIKFFPAEILNKIKHSGNDFYNWVQSVPFWSWTLSLSVIGYTLLFSFFPTVTADENVLHLRFWNNIQFEHRALFDINFNVAALIPFTVNLTHAGLSLMADADIRGAMNLVMVLCLLFLLFRIFYILSLPVLIQLLLVTLMATTPMLGLLQLTLNAELMLAVIVLAGYRLILNTKFVGQNIFGILACAALCASIKLSGAVAGIMVLIAVAVRWLNIKSNTPNSLLKVSWSSLIILFPLAFVALHPYALAWLSTGNPLFPFYNGIFKSNLFPSTNMKDLRWMHGFSLKSYFSLFFNTSKFGEHYNYSAGWQYLFLFPISLFAVWRYDALKLVRITLIPILGFGLIMFSSIQYWRYLFPILPLCSVIIASLFFTRNRLIRSVLILLTIICLTLNVIFFRRIFWVTTGTNPFESYTSTGKVKITSMYAPVKLLNEQINHSAPGSRVIYNQGASGPLASLNGIPLGINWYNPLRNESYNKLQNLEDVKRFLIEEDPEFAICYMGVNNRPDNLLREHLSKYGVPLRTVNNNVLYRLKDKPVVYKTIFDLRKLIINKSQDSLLILPTNDEWVEATKEGKVLSIFNTERASYARYSIKFKCTSSDGFFVAQINWDKGDPYFRLVECNTDISLFIESIPIPVGARQGSIWLSTRDNEKAIVYDLKVEGN